MKKVDTKGLSKEQIKAKIRERYRGLSSDLADVIPAGNNRTSTTKDSR